MSRPPHPNRIYNSNYTWRRVEIMQLLDMPHLRTLKSKKGTSGSLSHVPFKNQHRVPFQHVAVAGW
jgi:hypothetical protein